MAQLISNPTLAEMLQRKVCSSKDTMKHFLLYIKLCEVYRMRNVSWHSDKETGVIYSYIGCTKHTDKQHEQQIAQRYTIVTTHSSDERLQDKNITAQLAVSNELRNTNNAIDTPRDTKDLEEKPALNKITKDSDVTSVVSKSKTLLDSCEQVKVKPPQSNESNENDVASAPTDSTALLECDDEVCLAADVRNRASDRFLKDQLATVGRRFQATRLRLVPMSLSDLLGRYVVTEGIDDSILDQDEEDPANDSEEECSAEAGTVDGICEMEVDNDGYSTMESVHHTQNPKPYSTMEYLHPTQEPMPSSSVPVSGVGVSGPGQCFDVTSAVGSADYGQRPATDSSGKCIPTSSANLDWGDGTTESWD